METIQDQMKISKRKRVYGIEDDLLWDDLDKMIYGLLCLRELKENFDKTSSDSHKLYKAIMIGNERHNNC